MNWIQRYHRRREAIRRARNIARIRYRKECHCIMQADVVVGLWRDVYWCYLHGGIDV